MEEEPIDNAIEGLVEALIFVFFLPGFAHRLRLLPPGFAYRLRLVPPNLCSSFGTTRGRVRVVAVAVVQIFLFCLLVSENSVVGIV